MLIFLDAEFTGFNQPELISLALVSEFRRFEFYAELGDFDLLTCGAFVRQSVLPFLGQERLNRISLADRLRSWLETICSLDVSITTVQRY